MSFNFSGIKKALFGDDTPRPKLGSLDIEGVTQLIQDGQVNKIITMVGAGVSTDEILAKRVPKCLECKHVVKPDVVLFGESMPKKFFKNLSSDLNNCDLLIIMGTSLTVLPFCAMIHRVGNDVPRLYINREYNDGSTEPNYMKWGRSDNERDIFWSGNADDGVVKISELLGWKDDLLRLKEGTDSRLNEEFIAKKSHDKILTKSVGND
ncbi:unnamed protein product [Schistosoma haematobium]|nr:unnamed protein product [Schistosoma haematobium]CAH8679548.1 unnamed protein product [Schistosoma haematobium]